MASREMDRAAYLKLTAAEYLKQGYTDTSGRALPQLSSTFATAASTQFEAAQVSPQELGGTLEALRQVLPWHKDPDPKQRLRDAIDEALQVAAAIYNKPNHAAIVSWLEMCADAIRTDRDIDIFLAHFTAVVRQYTVIAKLRSV